MGASQGGEELNNPGIFTWSNPGFERQARATIDPPPAPPSALYGPWQMLRKRKRGCGVHIPPPHPPLGFSCWSSAWLPAFSKPSWGLSHKDTSR